MRIAANNSVILVVHPGLPGICYSGPKISNGEIYHIYAEYKIGGDLDVQSNTNEPIQMDGSGIAGLRHGNGVAVKNAGLDNRI